MEKEKQYQLKFKSDCHKKQFNSKKIAKKFLKLFNKEYGLGLTDVYYCVKCSSWHHTSLPKETNREYNHIKK